MIRALWTAATGMKAQQTNMDVIAHNLANVNTAGFKKSRADFQDLIYQSEKTVGAPATASTTVPAGIEVGLGTKVAAVTKLFTTGAINQTGNDLDLAIEGDGFYQITLPDGSTAYSRAGAFKKDATGRLVNADGYPLGPELVVPANATRVNVGLDGTVSVNQAGQTGTTTIGAIQLALFANPSGLSSIGHNLYKPTDASGDAVVTAANQNGAGGISQGYLEMSNVNVVEEMVSMITGQRAYEVNSKSIQAADEMLQKATNLGR